MFLETDIPGVVVRGPGCIETLKTVGQQGSKTRGYESPISNRTTKNTKLEKKMEGPVPYIRYSPETFGLQCTVTYQTWHHAFVMQGPWLCPS